MTTIKDRILVGIARQGRVMRPSQLEPDAGTGEHDIVHVLWRLQKQGLIKFVEHKRGPRTFPIKITLTQAGQEHVRKLRHDPTIPHRHRPG